LSFLAAYNLTLSSCNLFFSSSSSSSSDANKSISSSSAAFFAAPPPDINESDLDDAAKVFFSSALNELMWLNQR
jgi:hypothetical protein